MSDDHIDGPEHLSQEERANDLRVAAMDAQVAAGKGNGPVLMATGVLTAAPEPTPEPVVEEAPLIQEIRKAKAPARGKSKK